MVFMIKALVKLVRALCSNTAPAEIAHAFAWGVILGFLPKDNALWYILFVLIFFMRIQRGVFSLAVLVVSLFAGVADPLFDQIGYWVLTHPAMQDTMTKLINIPFVAFTKINNTIVMGCIICGICAYVPLYLFSRLFTFIWRRYIGGKLKNIKFIKAIGKIPLIRKIADIAQGELI